MARGRHPPSSIDMKRMAFSSTHASPIFSYARRAAPAALEPLSESAMRPDPRMQTHIVAACTPWRWTFRRRLFVAPSRSCVRRHNRPTPAHALPSQARSRCGRVHTHAPLRSGQPALAAVAATLACGALASARSGTHTASSRNDAAAATSQRPA